MIHAGSRPGVHTAMQQVHGQGEHTMTTSTVTDANRRGGPDLAGLPLSEFQQQVGSSPAGLSAEEVQRRLTQIWLQRVGRGRSQPPAEVPLVSVGTHSLDDRNRRHPLGGRSPLGGFLDHPYASGSQRHRWVLGGVPGRQCHRRAEETVGTASKGQTRRRLEHDRGP